MPCHMCNTSSTAQLSSVPSPSLLPRTTHTHNVPPHTFTQGSFTAQQAAHLLHASILPSSTRTDGTWRASRSRSAPGRATSRLRGAVQTYESTVERAETSGRRRVAQGVCVSTGSERKQMGERAWDQARRRRSRGVHASSGGMKKGRATGVRVHVLGEGVWLGSARRKHRWEPRTVCRVAAPWVLLHHQPALQLLLEHRPGLLPVQRRGRGQAPPHGSKRRTRPK